MEKISVGTLLKFQNTDGREAYAQVCGISFTRCGGVIEKVWISGGKNNLGLPEFFTPDDLKRLGAEHIEVQDVLDELNK